MMTEDYKTPSGAAPPDWRALCEELTEHLALLDEPPHELVCRAQEALAQPEPEVVGPTDEELLSLDHLRESWNAQADYMNSWDQLGTDEIIWWAQRQALARWGNQPAPPVKGEVAEVAAWLRAYSDEEFGPHNEDPDTRWFARAADLLEQRHSTPVPVSERLPGPEDCDAEGRCWWGKPYGYRGRNIAEPYWIFGDSDCYRFMACALWLPATALPLLTTEV